MITLEQILRAVPGTTVEDADRLLEIEAGAVAFVETQTGRYFGPPELFEEFIYGKGGSRIYLRDHVTSDPDYPGDAAVVTLSERGVIGGNPTELHQDTDFVLRQGTREFVLLRTAGDAWPVNYENEAIYWRGYQAGEEPADIRELVIGLIQHRWDMVGKAGLRSETIGGYAWSRFEGSDLDAVPGARDTIEAWRRPAVA